MRAWSAQNYALNQGRRHARDAGVGPKPCDEHQPKVWGLNQDRAKVPLHQAMAELKAARVGVVLAEEGVGFERVHRCTATRAYGNSSKHLHAQAVPQKSTEMDYPR